MTEKPLNSRLQAQQLLEACLIQQEPLSPILADFRQRSALSAKDRALVEEIVQGVLQYHYRLRDGLKPFITVKQTLDNRLWLILEAALYQKWFLDRIPDHAILNEGVAVAKTIAHQGAANAVNAILRRALTEAQQPGLLSDKNKDLSRYYSVPLPIVSRFRQQYGLDATKALLESLTKPALLHFRTLKDEEDRDHLVASLQAKGYELWASPYSPLGVTARTGELLHDEAFAQGKVIVQDLSSQQVGLFAPISGQEHILDVCAAPGGKTTHIAQQLTSGHLQSNDRQVDKCAKIRENVERVGLSDRVTFTQEDARFLKGEANSFDGVIADLPCSGLGLMRRKKDIRYHFRQQSLEELVDLQRQILEQILPMVKAGGWLMYSTCTLTHEENQDQIQWLLDNYPEWKVDPIEGCKIPGAKTKEGFLEILPHLAQTDGFFVARLRKGN